MNGLMPYTTTATELQRDYKRVAQRARRIKQPLVVLSNNKPEGVYMDYRVYQGVGNRQVSRQKKTTGLDDLFGSWTKKEAEEFDRIIEEMFEQVDPEMWK